MALYLKLRYGHGRVCWLNGDIESSKAHDIEIRWVMSRSLSLAETRRRLCIGAWMPYGTTEFISPKSCISLSCLYRNIGKLCLGT